MRFAAVLLVTVPGLLAQDARALFASRCSVCHGDGYGTERGPNLANRRVRSQPLDAVRDVIRKGMPATGMPAFDLPPAELNALAEFVKALGAPAFESRAPGDKAAGERYFFSEGGCSGCHMVHGRGKPIGPDLSSIARETTLADIEQSVAEPSARLRPGYETVTARLFDGRLIRGFARNRSRYNAQIQDLAGTFHLLDSTAIASLQVEPGSLMPPRRCAPAECRDVVAFLASLGGVVAGARGLPLTSEAGIPFTAVANPKPGDWPSYHGHLSGNRHSDLAQINPGNVASLALKWVFPINHFVLQVTPVVVDGVMYVTGPNQVFALDGRAGRTIWHYERPRSTEARGDPAKGTNRGVAVLGDRVFFVTDNARLVALHRVTGQPLWETDITAGIDKKNTGNTAAPIVVNDLIITGISGGDLGMRGFLSAYRVTTGELVWRFWTVPKPGEPLSDGWKGTDLATFGGGGGTWMTGTYDPATGLVYWGVGNPYPALNGDQRQGDNLYTASVLALEAATGKLRWHYQFTPHDLFDWDAGQTPLLADRVWRGKPRQLLLQANRNGFFYVLDRTSGELLLAEKFADKVTWASRIGKDGRPVLVPGQEPTLEGTKVCPNILGAANWPSVALSPHTGWFYVMAREACGIYAKGRNWAPRRIALEPGQMFLRALDIETGKRVWEVPNHGPADSWGGVLSSGGVIFFGEDSGAIGAVDARTGKDLWHLQTNAAMALGDGHSWRSSPMTYLAGGRQYIAFAAGPNILAFGLP